MATARRISASAGAWFLHHLGGVPGSANRPSCPNCGSEAVLRSRRVGVLERLLGTLYVYPFRCAQCRWRFRLVRWGERYRRTTPGRRVASFLVAGVLLGSAAPARPEDAPQLTPAAVAITYLAQQEITGQVIGPAIAVPRRALDFRLGSAGTAVNGPASVSVVLQFSYDAGLTWQHVVGASGGELPPAFTGHGLTGRVEGLLHWPASS